MDTSTVTVRWFHSLNHDFFLAFNRDVATADVILEIKDLFRALFSGICCVKFNTKREKDVTSISGV